MDVPGNIEMCIRDSYGPTQYISATMAEIVETLVIALILVVGITYLFLSLIHI